MTAEKASHLLIVDDEPGVLSIVERIARRTLPPEAMPVIEKAESPGRALEMLAGKPHGLVAIISDYNMGVPQNGLDLLKEIHRLYPESRRVLMSAYAKEEFASGLEAAGVERVLSKPFDNTELKSVLRALVLGEDPPPAEPKPS